MAGPANFELAGLPAPGWIDGRFLRIARRYSLCDDDAAETLGRSLEIAIRQRERVRRETAAAWFATVIRHEALRVLRTRTRELSLDAIDAEPLIHEPEPAPETDPRLPALRAAMRQLKPDERRALLLFYAMDAGRNDRYRRIMGATGWSYTKVNRCLTEGRAALRSLLDRPPAVDGAAPTTGTRTRSTPADRPGLAVAPRVR